MTEKIGKGELRKMIVLVKMVDEEGGIVSVGKCRRVMVEMKMGDSVDVKEFVGR